MRRNRLFNFGLANVAERTAVYVRCLQDAMSRQAQAERERQARVILGDAERQISQSFLQTAESYAGNPITLHLRAMNILYKRLKEKGAMIIVPSSAVETMGLGTISGLASLSAVAEQRPRGVPVAQGQAAQKSGAGA